MMKLNKDHFKSLEAAKKAFDRFCNGECSKCALNGDDHCAIAFMYLPAPRIGRPPKNEKLKMEN